MCSYDYDHPSVYNCEEVTARKQHTCSECGRHIEPKERYQKVFGVWCNDPNTFKTCAHCLVGQKWLMAACGGFLHGDLEDEIYEHADSATVKQEAVYLFRILIGMRRKWTKLHSNKMLKVPVLAEPFKN